MKRPSDPKAYIPYNIQTFAAPASYALHYALGPPSFDWGKLKEPVRLNCRDQSAQLLAEPQLLEQITFSDPQLPSSGVLKGSAQLTWKVDPARVVLNEKVLYDELKKEGAKEDEARRVSVGAARSLSAIALWPRLVLDPEGTLVVESRGPKGEHQKSHWQTVLPLLATRPVNVEPSQVIKASLAVDLRDGKPDTPLKYVLTAELGGGSVDAAAAAPPENFYDEKLAAPDPETLPAWQRRRNGK